MAEQNETENEGESSAVIPCYNFQMYQKKNCVFTEKVHPMARSGHRIVCNDQDVYLFGGYNPNPETSLLFCELWRYNIDTKSWDALQCENIPNAVASPGVILDKKILLVLGGYGYPLGADRNSYLFMCDLEPRDPNYVYKFRLIPTTGEKPPPSYGHCMLKDKEYLYTVGGTMGFNDYLNVHRLDLRTKVWEALFLAKNADEPKPRYTHECALFNKKIYVFGGCLIYRKVFGFKKLPVFDLQTFEWSLEQTHGDISLEIENQYPEKRKCHGCVQKPDNMAQVFIIGGCSSVHQWESTLKSDCWMIDLNIMAWTRMPFLDLEHPTFFHSSAVTPSGKLFIHGGIIRENGEPLGRTEKMFESWIQIPPLKEMCWEAVRMFIHKRVYVGDVIQLPEEYKLRIRKLDSATVV